MQLNKILRCAHKIGLAMLMFYSMTASAAYIVMDDDLMPTVEAQPAFSHYEVPFSKGSASLTNAGRAVLNMTLSQMRGQTVRIIGRPDAAPSKKMKLANLAEDRSNNVRKYLLQEGIKSDDIIIDDDQTPNPQKNGNTYPIDLYISQATKLQNFPAPVVTASTPLIAVTQVTSAIKNEVKKPQELPALAPVQIATKTQLLPSAPAAAPTKVEGSFKVIKNEAAIKSQSQEMTQPSTSEPTSYDFSTKTQFNAEARASIERLAANAREITVIADGSIAGYKRAKEISTYINKVTGNLPEIKTTGAPKGLVTVKG